MWIPLLRPVANKQSCDWLLLPVTFPLAVVGLVLLGGLLLLCAPVTVACAFATNWRQGRRVRTIERALRRQGRLLGWTDLEAKAEGGHGTLLVCTWPLSGVHTIGLRKGAPRVDDFYQVWWIAQSSGQMEPAPIRLEERLYGVQEGPDASFTRRYLAVQGGAASLTLSGEKLPEGEPLSDQLRRRFPRADVVVLFS